MMKIQIKFIIISFCIAMVGCARLPFFQNKAINNPCSIHCLQKLKACQQMCHNDCVICKHLVKKETETGYKRYRHEKCVEGGILSRQLLSYRDPLQCRKVTCNCRADYRVCKQSCSGVIMKRLQEMPVC